jgi:putative NADH-flavin reductase
MSQELTLLIGATGPTGEQIVARARADGQPIRALARDRARAQSAAWNPDEVFHGDVLDRASLDAAMAGVSAVLVALGTPLTLRPVSLLSEGTRHIVEAMGGAGVTRLLCITGVGAGDSRGHGGIVYDGLILPLLLGRIYADKDRQEALVSGSGLDWTLIRPARLTDKGARHRYREITRFAGETMSTISRADVAHFVVKELREKRYRRRCVNLSD